MPLLKTRREETSRKSIAAETGTDAQVAARVDALLCQISAQDLQPNPDIVRELQSMGDAALPLIVAALERRMMRHRVRTRLAIIGGFALTAVTLPLHRYFLSWWGIFLVLLWPFSIVLAILAVNEHALQAADLRLLTQMEDPRILGLLIDAYARTSPLSNLKDSSAIFPGEVRTSLLHLLPRLDAAGKDLLDDKRRNNLRRVLRKAARHPFIDGKADTELAFAAVKALVQIRDIESLGTLRRLARKAYDPDVRAIAARGVAELEAMSEPRA